MSFLHYIHFPLHIALLRVCSAAMTVSCVCLWGLATAEHYIWEIDHMQTCNGFTPNVLPASIKRNLKSERACDDPRRHVRGPKITPAVGLMEIELWQPPNPIAYLK